MPNSAPAAMPTAKPITKPIFTLSKQLGCDCPYGPTVTGICNTQLRAQLRAPRARPAPHRPARHLTATATATAASASASGAGGRGGAAPCRRGPSGRPSPRPCSCGGAWRPCGRFRPPRGGSRRRHRERGPRRTERVRPGPPRGAGTAPGGPLTRLALSAGPRGDGDGALRPLYLDVQATTPLVRARLPARSPLPAARPPGGKEGRRPRGGGAALSAVCARRTRGCWTACCPT